MLFSGMAAFSMCFTLMADEVVAKFKWLGTKIGFRKKDDEEGDSGDGNDDAEGAKSKS